MTALDLSSETFRIELADGSLDLHDLTVGDPDGAAPVVLGVHGITANGLSWQCVADEVYRRRGPGSVRFLAPDLRGRGSSRDLPGPYGLARHADDLAGVTDVFGVRPVLVGHSMGAYVAALVGARHPDRVAAAVLVDGGVAFPPPDGADVDEVLRTVLGPAMARLETTFAGPDDYLDVWRRHPAVGPVLAGEHGPELRRHLLHDLVRRDEAGDQAGWVSSCRLDAVRADGADVLLDPVTHGAARRAVAEGVPVELVWAGRGLLDEPQGLYDAARLAALDLPPQIRVTAVPDSNHYSIVLEAAGVGAVVDALERVLEVSPRT